jgi:hypothetical protein
MCSCFSKFLLPLTRCCGFGSARTRNFCQNPDPELQVMDPDLELDFNLIKIHLKKNTGSNLIITDTVPYDIKNILIYGNIILKSKSML